MMLLAAKGCFRVCVLRVERKPTGRCVSFTNLIQRGKSCCIISRTQSFTQPHASFTNDSQKRNEEAEKAKNVAVGYVMKRMVSQQQLRVKLMERGITDEQVIQATLNQMIDLRLQSDLEYATSFATSKWRRDKWSFQKIRWELRNRHKIEDRVIDRAFKEAFLHQNDRGFDEEYYYQALLQQIQDRVDGRLHRLDEVTKKRRITSWLSRRQHPWNTIYRIINDVQWARTLS